MSYWVYILTNKLHSTLYIVVTNNPLRRLEEYRRGSGSKFVRKYNLQKLIFLEEATNSYDSLNREKQLKGWRRSRKDALINATNPHWKEIVLTPDHLYSVLPNRTLDETAGMTNNHTNGGVLVTRSKIAITLESGLLEEVDELVRQRVYPNRSRAIQEAVEEKLGRLRQGLLARECAKLDPDFEASLADEGLEEDLSEWPEY